MSVEEQIVGKWQWYTITYNFHSDGTYEYYNSDSGLRTNGRYAFLKEGFITFLLGSAFSSEYSLRGDNLVLRPEGGDPTTFKRMK